MRKQLAQLEHMPAANKGGKMISKKIPEKINGEK